MLLSGGTAQGVEQDQPCTGNGMRVADFNLDGAQDLLVVCRELGRSRLYMGNPDRNPMGAVVPRSSRATPAAARAPPPPPPAPLPRGRC